MSDTAAATSNTTTTDNMKRKVDHEMEETKNEINKVNGKIDGVEEHISAIESECNDLKGVLKNSKTFNKFWRDLPKEDQRMFYKSNKDLCYAAKCDELKELRDELKELRDTLKQLLKDKEQLRDKEKDLRDQEKKLLAQDTTSKLKRSRTIRSFTDYTGTFQENVPQYDFEFVNVPTLQELVDLLTHTMDLWEKNYGNKYFAIPMITGGSGSGKTRLAHEASQRMKGVVENGAATIYVDCQDVQYVMRNAVLEKDAAKILTHALLEAFDGETRWQDYDYTFHDVLDKMVNDMEVTTFFLHLDEYSSNPYFAKLALKVCKKLFRHTSKIALVPILSGVPVLNLPLGLAEVADKVSITTYTLRGVDDVNGLRESFLKEVGKIAKPPSTLEMTSHMKGPLALLCGMFGCLPVLYLFLYQFLQRSPRYLSLLVDRKWTGVHGKEVLQGIASMYDTQYGVRVWAGCFLSKIEKYLTREKRISDRSHSIIVEHIKRVHTIAIAGVEVDLNDLVVPEYADPKNDKFTMSFRNLSASGMFTLDATNDKGTIVMAPLAIYALVHLTHACEKEALSVFEYSADMMESVALAALQCRWNALYYSRGKCQVPYWDLRPGALCHDKPATGSPAYQQALVAIGRPLDNPLCLALHLTQKKDVEYTYMNGTSAPLAKGKMYMCAKDEPCIDGFALLEDCRIWSQTKSAQLVCPKTTGDASTTKIHTSTLETIVNNQAAHKENAKMGNVYRKPIVRKPIVRKPIAREPIDVYDVFTNRFSGNVKIPKGYNVLVTNRANFREVVGPVFGQIADLLPLTE